MEEKEGEKRKMGKGVGSKEEKKEGEEGMGKVESSGGRCWDVGGMEDGMAGVGSGGHYGDAYDVEGVEGGKGGQGRKGGEGRRQEKKAEEVQERGDVETVEENREAKKR